MKLKDMDREEILDLKHRAELWLACHKKEWWWLRVQFGSSKQYSRQILDGDFKHGWPKLDDIVRNMTSLAPHYFADMRQALITFELLPDTCAEIRRQIDALEPTYQAVVDKWLDIKSSLSENRKTPEPERPAPEDTGRRFDIARGTEGCPLPSLVRLVANVR